MEGCLEMGGCHIILRFYRRFSMMQQTKKRLDVFFLFQIKYEMIGIVIWF